jgi:hypothetical protein
MNTKNSVTESLISSRNILLNGRCNESILICLQEILDTLDSISVVSSKNIIAYCVSEAIAQIKTLDFVSAGMILNLIHNLPLDEASETRWDIDYFLSMELVTFLENFETIKCSRKIVLTVFCQLSLQYLTPEIRIVPD